MVEPRHHTSRSDLPTHGGRVAALAEAKGKPLMPWQRRAIDVALEYYPDTGLYRYGTIVLTVPRQAGKTTLVGAWADYVCLSRRDARVWITMQNGKMADSWMRNDHLPTLRVFGNPERGKSSCPYTKSLRAGEVGPLWKSNNSTFFTFPPKRDALHSKQSDLVIVSEAWAHSADTGAEIRQAVRPTMSTRPKAQLIVESTMGDDASVYFDGYVDLGIASLTNPDSRVCIIDYGIPEDADAEDLDVIAAHHPALGHTISLQSLLDAREEFRSDPLLGGTAGWARAYGNRPTRSRVAAFPPGIWEAAGTERVDMPDRYGLAFDVNPAGTHVAVVSAWRGQDNKGRPRAFLEDHAEIPVREAAGYIAALAKARSVPVGYDTVGPATLELADQVAKHRGVKLVGMATREFATSCARIDREVLDGTLAHFRQPTLNEAVSVAVRRNIMDGGFAWGRSKSTGNIAPLVAGTVALKMFDDLPARRSFKVVTATTV